MFSTHRAPSVAGAVVDAARRMRRPSMPLRHSVLWTLRDTTTDQERLRMLQGLAFLCLECRDVRVGDYGDDLFGGSEPLRQVRPSRRTPRWRSPGKPPANYDLALHLDFDDWARHDAYGADPVHDAASAFNESVSWDELTARVDWWAEDERPLRGSTRHVAMFVWAGEVAEIERTRAIDGVRRLEAVPGVVSVATGNNVGHLTTDFDWILDVNLADAEAAARFVDGEAYATATAELARVTKPEWTARVTHRVRG
jgi:hypothetical protein